MHALNTKPNEQQVSHPRYNLTPEDYKLCHPYIYWWVKTILAPLNRGTIHVDDYRICRAFKIKSFMHPRVQKSLSDFIRTHAQIIQSWSIRTYSEPCPPIKEADITKAIQVSRR